MMKFFRKYNKQLLAVFMVALMVVFVGGSALQGLLTPETNPVVAASKFGPITFMDQQVANDQGKLLENLGFDWRRPAGWTAKPLETMDWILLRREAQELGASASAASVRSTLADPEFDARLNDLSRRLRVRPESLHTAFADLQSIRQAASGVAGASVPSEAELMLAARNALETVSVRAVALPAEMFVDESVKFSEQEIKDQFEKHRDKERGPGLNFGYYQRPGIKAQYIKIDRDAIAENIGVANLERKAKAYFDERRTKDPAYARPGANEPDPAAVGKIVGPPGPPVEPFLTWEEAKDTAIAATRKQSADQAAERIAGWLSQYTTESFLEVDRGADGYRPAPAAVARPEYYEEIVAKVPTSIAFPEAVSVGVTDFFSDTQADDVPVLGSTRFQPERGASQSFNTLVFRTQAIVPKVPGTEGTNPADYLATFQTSQNPLTDPQTGSLYVFRVIAARPGHAPTDVEEVREQVIEDLRLARAYEVAKSRAASLQQCLSHQSLKEAYESDLELLELKERVGTANAGYFEPPAFSRVPKGQAARGRLPGGMFVGAGLGQISNELVDDCFALEHAAEKTEILELPERPGVILVEWVETKPAPEDEFNTLRKQLVTQLTDARWRSAIADWLDPEQVRARTGFSLARQ
jgi:hypothetical protein